MTYTQEQLEGFSNTHINHIVRLIQYPHSACDNDMKKLSFDYCNNWADIGPLIVEAKIGVDYCYIEKTHRACWVENGNMLNGQTYLVKNKNPLRAAAIIYILVKQEENK